MNLYRYGVGRVLSMVDPQGLRANEDALRSMCDDLEPGPNATASCNNCDECICEDYVDRILEAMDFADQNTGRIDAVPFIGEGQCHAWGTEFSNNLGSEQNDHRACLKVYHDIIGLNPQENWRPLPPTISFDHDIHWAKNQCSGKCLILDNGGWGPIQDPCTMEDFGAHYFSVEGARKWDNILDQCNCPENAEARPNAPGPWDLPGQSTTDDIWRWSPF